MDGLGTIDVMMMITTTNDVVGPTVVVQEGVIFFVAR